MSYYIDRVTSWKVGDRPCLQLIVKDHQDRKVVLVQDDNEERKPDFLPYNEMLFEVFLANARLKTGMYDPSEAMTAFMTSLLQEHMQRQYVKRHCRRKTLYRLAGDPANTYRYISEKYGPAVKAEILARHGGKEVEIMNEQL